MVKMVEEHNFVNKLDSPNSHVCKLQSLDNNFDNISDIWNWPLHNEICSVSIIIIPTTPTLTTTIIPNR